MSGVSNNSNISAMDLERKLYNLEDARRVFRAITDNTYNNQGVLEIEKQIDLTTKIYSNYITIVANLRNICASLGIDASDTLFRNNYDDLIIHRSLAKKYSLGFFFIKHTTFHLAIPIKIVIKGKLDITIYKPIIINLRLDYKKKIDIIALEIFKNKSNDRWCGCDYNFSTCGHDKEPTKVFNIKVSDQVKDEFPKPHIKIIKAAINSAIEEGLATSQSNENNTKI